MNVFFFSFSILFVTIAHCANPSTFETCSPRRQVKISSFLSIIIMESPYRSLDQNQNSTQQVIPQPTPSRSCRMSVSRTVKGVSIGCTCREGSTVVPAEIITGIHHNCVKSCVQTRSLNQACESGHLSRFQSLAKSTRNSCCMDTCGGLPDGGTCVRTGPFSAPTRTSSSRCVVSLPVQPYGDQFACSCEGRMVVVSPIVYSGIQQSCISRCARRRLDRTCKPNKSRSEILDGMYDVFGQCCGHCGGVSMDGGLACGARV